MRTVKVILLVLAAAWATLFFTSQALLVSGKQVRLGGDGQDSLVCVYFTCTGFIEQQFWHPNGILGRPGPVRGS